MQGTYRRKSAAGRRKQRLNEISSINVISNSPGFCLDRIRSKVAFGESLLHHRGPGSGKSSLMQYLVLGSSGSDKAVPLLIELGKYVRDGAKPRTLLEFLEKEELAIYHLHHDSIHQSLKEAQASSGQTVAETGNFAILIHPGSETNTYSAGCQTIPRAEFLRFYGALKSQQTDFFYVLVTPQ